MKVFAANAITQATEYSSSKIHGSAVERQHVKIFNRVLCTELIFRCDERVRLIAR